MIVYDMSFVHRLHILTCLERGGICSLSGVASDTKENLKVGIEAETMADSCRYL